jgi:hypothetical protein
MEYKYTTDGEELTLEQAQARANSTGSSVHLYTSPGDNGADYVTVAPENAE